MVSLLAQNCVLTTILYPHARRDADGEIDGENLESCQEDSML